MGENEKTSTLKNQINKTHNMSGKNKNTKVMRRSRSRDFVGEDLKAIRGISKWSKRHPVEDKEARERKRRLIRERDKKEKEGRKIEKRRREEKASLELERQIEEMRREREEREGEKPMCCDIN